MDNKQLAALVPGDVIQCPECLVKLAIIALPIHIGEIIKAEQFNWISKQYTDGEALVCDNCSSPFGRDVGLGHQVYVKGLGWTP